MSNRYISPLMVMTFLVISTLYASAQTFVLKGFATRQDHKPLSGAMIIRNDKNTNILTNSSGTFNLTVSVNDTIKLQYDGANDYLIIPEFFGDTLEYHFVLTMKSKLLEEVKVKNNRVKFITGEKNEYLLDYFVFEDESMLLLKNLKNQYFLTYQKSLTESSDYLLPFVPRSFYMDCMGNILIEGKDSTYQFWVDSSFHIDATMGNEVVKEKYKPYIYCGETDAVYSSFNNMNRKYTLVHSNEDTMNLMLEVFDTVGYYDLYEQWAQFKTETCSDPGRIDRNAPLKYQYLKNSQNRNVKIPGSSGLGSSDSRAFVKYEMLMDQVENEINIQTHKIGSFIVAVDLYNYQVNVFKTSGEKLHEARIKQADKEKKIVLKDPYTKKFYLSNKDNATLELDILNIDNGDHNTILKLLEVHFPEKVKIFNGKLYFVAGNEYGYHKLYMVNLHLEE